MARLNPHLHFNGNCLEAFKFYEKCFDGKITFSMTWGESPSANDVPKNWADKIIHASLEFDNQMISADDAPPDYGCKAQGFEILVSFLDVKKAENAFKMLSEEGEIRMPFEETFWAYRFGMVTDKFGTPWMINCGKPKGEL